MAKVLTGLVLGLVMLVAGLFMAIIGSETIGQASDRHRPLPIGAASRVRSLLRRYFLADPPKGEVQTSSMSRQSPTATRSVMKPI